MAQKQLVARDALDDARRQVRQFFAEAATLSRAQVQALWREERRSGVRGLSTQPEFLQAVAQGAWSPAHVTSAREIRATAQAQAARLVKWPHRRALASAFEHAALAVFSAHDPTNPLGGPLRDRLIEPWRRATRRDVPLPRRSAA